MPEAFFERPILNSPYEYPKRHWELDESGQPTQGIIERRRGAEFVTPIPRPRKQKGAAKQSALLFDEGLSTQAQQYHSAIINGVRAEVDRWRALKNPADWKVTPETARLLQHWRSHPFAGVRPFFCQVEAVETAIWLTEVAPKLGKSAGRFLAAEVDPDAWATLNSDTSRPFDRPTSGRIAVKVINHLGDEVMKVFRA